MTWDRLLRWLAAAGGVGEAVAHIPLIADHLEEAPYIGVGFVLLSVAGILLAQLLVSADVDDDLVWALAGLVATAALVGYTLSRSVGLPQIHDDIGNWGDPLGMVAVVSELVMLSCVVSYFRRPRARRRRGELVSARRSS